ncbi:MAG TPA: SDR family NAD(P)-dependent oxidoreductase [Candidatus Dojkabacteria bacterium]|nr:SDR family NAD(P)-dependent oxidoreductase [Candidatus Dojkabacteria bacterium]
MKYVLVTGSSKGIGKAIALELARDDYYVFVHYHKDYKAAEQTANEIRKLGKKCSVVQGDISSQFDMEELFRQVGRITDSLDLLVNNAGTDYDCKLEEYELAKMKRVLDVNLWGTMLVTKLANPFLKKSGAGLIINIASRMGVGKMIEGVGAYAPSKAGIIRFTKCCALELAQAKIRANAVCPRLTETEITRLMFPDDSFWKQSAQQSLLGRVGKPEDVAHLVAFLASDKAGYINGEEILVDGGSVLQ